MSDIEWSIDTSEDALDFISQEYNRLESFKEGLGERFFERIEGVYSRIKQSPLSFEKKTPIYRKALVGVSKRLQYALYFRLGEPHIFVDLILPTSSDPDLHPSS